MISDVSLASGKLLLLDGLSLTLPDPGLYHLNGPTGSGKSLICRLIGGRLKPRSGSVLIDGERPRNAAAGHTSDFYSEAGALTTFDESIWEFMAAELRSAGVSTAAAAEYFGLLESRFTGGVNTPLRHLSEGEVLILQVMLAAAAPGRTAILDGHLNVLSRDAATYCWQILQSSLAEHEKFIILTSCGDIGHLGGETASIRLAGGLPVTVLG